MNNINTGIYGHLFEYYPANENLELDVFQMTLVARETLPYIKLLDESDIFLKGRIKMVTEKDKRFREALLHTLEEYKVNKIDFDEIVFWITKDAKRIYVDEEL